MKHDVHSSSYKFMTFWYLCAISLIAPLSTCGYFALSSVISNQDKTSSLINLSGRQRRWCVTIAYYCSEIAHTIDKDHRQQLKAKLLDANEDMRIAHHELTEEGGEFHSPEYFSPKTAAIYFQQPILLDAKVRAF